MLTATSMSFSLEQFSSTIQSVVEQKVSNKADRTECLSFIFEVQTRIVTSLQSYVTKLKIYSATQEEERGELPLEDNKDEIIDSVLSSRPECKKYVDVLLECSDVQGLMKLCYLSNVHASL